MSDDPNQGADLLRMLGQQKLLGSNVLPAPPGAPAQAASSPAAPKGAVQNMDIPALGRALLATIGSQRFESNGSYTQRFNQPDFSDFSKHPGTYGAITRGPNAGLKSNAAGRYQFLSTTWANQAKQLGLRDFSPESQDAAAWNLAKQTYSQATRGRDLTADLHDPKNLPGIAQALHSQWTSLPGGIETRSKTADFTNAFMANAQSEMARGPGNNEPGFNTAYWQASPIQPTGQGGIARSPTAPAMDPEQFRQNMTMQALGIY